ncbi:hypothetical protein [Pedobacter metabolipauper]|uniref:hypothetical protein n=1 Tax=Pedobacter metabolipauper TaxID=425513 RepID=UPI00105E2A63|nr:hypothetical protein [Pedobacter metabolipauper]
MSYSISKQFVVALKAITIPAMLMMVGMISSCNKAEEITTDKSIKLAFSSDTVLFDTVFTTVGSVNKRIKVYNTSQKTINISNIQLSGGSSSYFSLIINGFPVNQKTNTEVAGKDSINVYIKVTINPNNQNQPFIVQDSILFSINGNKQSVPLIAYGQNAVFINDQVINKNTNWTNTLPYIIYKSVTIAENTTLTIQPGVKVLFHGNSGMLVKGSLRASGNVSNPILFSSDRLESEYEELSGQWNGIHFYNSSTNSAIGYSLIKNAVIGITSDSLSINSSPKLILYNSIIKNMEIAGFIGYKTELDAFNNLFHNTGQYLLYGVGGGRYNLKQNTFAGYNFNFPRQTPALYFSDQNGSVSSTLNLEIVNNIIWGTLTEEFLIEKKTSLIPEPILQNNLIKTNLQTYAGNGNLLNTDPGFFDFSRNNFTLQVNSNAVRKGKDLSNDPYFNSMLSKDLNNLTRSFPSSLGCYEH